MSYLLRIALTPRLAAAFLLLASFSLPAVAQNVDDVEEVDEEEETDEAPSSTSSILDALNDDSDPAATSTADEAEEEEDVEAVEEVAEDAVADADAEVAPAVSATPVVAEAAPAQPAARGGIDPITGARYGSSGPRQAAHIIIKREERAEGLHEITLSNPIQANGKFTQHVGVSLDYLFHLREAFAIGFGGTYNYYAAQSQFTEDLNDRAKQQPYPASALLLDWEGHVGIEVSPIYGKYALFDWSVVQFGFYFGAYAGLGHTKVQLRKADPDQDRPRTFGDTGLRPVGLFSAGMRMFLGKHVALRFELRDTIYSDEVSRINGCTWSDLNSNAGVAASCNKDAFYDKESDGAIAKDLLKEPSSDVLHNVAFVAGLSVLF